MVDRRLSHDDLGLPSSPSAKDSLPVVVFERRIPLLLSELPLDSVNTLSFVEARSGSRSVFRRKSEAARDCCMD